MINMKINGVAQDFISPYKTFSAFHFLQIKLIYLFLFSEHKTLILLLIIWVFI